jgi:ribosomal protein S21
MTEVVTHDDECLERALKRKRKMSAARRKRRRPRAA